MITGNPVRKPIVDIAVSKDEALQRFGLEKNKITILVMGGSLGAKSINDVIAAHVHEFISLDIQLIWQTGKNNAVAYKERGSVFSNIWVDTFITDMEQAYVAADIVVSRAGAMSVAEICVVKKPAIFVPYPHAAEDHQTVNAMHLVNKGAAWIVRDQDAVKELFSKMVALAKDVDLQKTLQEKIATLGIANADEVVATEILNTIGG